jgi:hypothetical protein
MMNSDDLNELKQAVDRLHSCKASPIEDVTVIAKFVDKTVWSGVVSVFRDEGHPQADKCYAWSSLIERSMKRRYFAVLHVCGRFTREGVRPSIVHDHKQGKLKQG